jgi:hypothetical protein
MSLRVVAGMCGIGVIPSRSAKNNSTGEHANLSAGRLRLIAQSMKPVPTCDGKIAPERSASAHEQPADRARLECDEAVEALRTTPRERTQEG